MRRLALFVVLALFPVCAWGEMPSGDSIKAVANAWLAKRPAPGFSTTMTMEDAAKVQAQYTALIATDLGEVVAYIA